MQEEGRGDECQYSVIPQEREGNLQFDNSWNRVALLLGQELVVKLMLVDGRVLGSTIFKLLAC